MDLLDQEKDIARKQPESLHLRIGKVLRHQEEDAEAARVRQR
jgi:hypothetical protein